MSTTPTFPNEVQAYAAGIVEGYLTRDLIDLTWQNQVKGYCEKPYNKFCTDLRNFLQENINWVKAQIDQERSDLDYWGMVSSVYCLIRISQSPVII